MDRGPPPRGLDMSIVCLMCNLVFSSLFTFFWLMFISSVAVTVYYIYAVYPEIGMVVNSQCKNPTPNWNGQIMNIPVWYSGFDGRNETHNSYLDTTGDRRLLHYSRLLAESSRSNDVDSSKSLQRARDLIAQEHDGKEHEHSYEHKYRLLLASGFSDDEARRILVAAEANDPVIIWGSHHKTGTYVAEKAFSHVCKQMKWCCIFHVTRDSIHVIEETLETEPVKVLGHTQWIWYPEEVGIKHYRFVHLFRKPYKKIVSGYRYHRDGAEAWCKKELYYTKACDFSDAKTKAAIQPYATKYGGGGNRNSGGGGRYLRWQVLGSESFNEVISTEDVRLLLNSSGTSTGATSDSTSKSSSTSSSSSSSVAQGIAPSATKGSTSKSNSTTAKTTHKPATKATDAAKKKPHTKHSGKDASSFPSLLTRNEIQDYCHSVHLCEPCCRREHEIYHVTGKHHHPHHSSKSNGLLLVPDSRRRAAEDEQRENEGNRQLWNHKKNSTSSSGNSRIYVRHSQNVYDFQCRNLGPMTGLSLMDTLLLVPPEVGVKVEASVDYYESLRMARIFNHTWKDPHSLNIDLDDLMEEYSLTMRRVLAHIDIPLSTSATETLAKELDFFDVNSSPVYRWSMTNPFVNHVDTKSASDPTDYKGILAKDPEVAEIYRPIHDLMHAAMHKGSSVSAAEKRIAGKMRSIEGSQ